MTEVLISVFALISLVGFCTSNFCKSKKKILSVQLICNISDILMYLMSKGMTGLASSISGFLRNIAFIKFNNSKAVILFSSIKVILLIMNYENILTLVLIILEITAAVIIIFGTAQQLRILTTVRQAIWVVYDFIMVSALVSLTSIIKFCFCLASVIVHRRQGESDGQ